MTASPEQSSPRRPPVHAVRANDWSVLQPPVLAGWTPTRSVSVVIPAFNCERTVELTLASLAAQTYPSSLLEVVVVDDGSTPPLVLPDRRPENTRLVRSSDSSRGWGPGHARAVGARASDGEIIHWLDSDMVVFAEHVAAQARWHDLADHLVTLGYKRFVEPVPMTAQHVFDAVAAGAADTLYDEQASEPHAWIEKLVDETNGLRDAGFDAFRVHVGATATVGRELYFATGGMDPDLKLGEDSELGYRLSQVGAVFVPEPEARSWHLGRSTIMRTVDVVTRHNRPFITDRMPVPRYRRRSEPGRIWSVPLVEVRVDVEGAEYEAVKASVDSVLLSSVSDLTVALVGDWAQLHDGRRSPLQDPHLPLRLLTANYAGDPRVRRVQALSPTAFPAPFRLHLPAGWTLGKGTIDHLFRHSHGRQLSLCLAARADVSPDVAVLRWERTAGVARALRLRDASLAGAGDGDGPAGDLDDLLDAVGGQRWYDADDLGVASGWPADVEPPVPVSGPPVTAEQWRRAAEKARADAKRWKADAQRWKQEAKAQSRALRDLTAGGRGRRLTRASARAVARRLLAGKRSGTGG